MSDDRILDKLDKMDEKIDNISVSVGKHEVLLEKQEENLREHMKRTDLLEQEVNSVKKKVHLAEGGIKLVGLVSTIGGLVYSCIQIAKAFL